MKLYWAMPQGIKEHFRHELDRQYGRSERSAIKADANSGGFGQDFEIEWMSVGILF